MFTTHKAWKCSLQPTCPAKGLTNLNRSMKAGKEMSLYSIFCELPVLLKVIFQQVLEDSLQLYIAVPVGFTHMYVTHKYWGPPRPNF